MFGACPHKNIKSGAYLPVFQDGAYGTIRNHTYCTECGTVRAQGPDRGRSIGHFLNLLHSLNLTECQIRLIAREMEADALFSDPFGSYYSSQMQAFHRIVHHYGGPEAARDVSR